MAASVALVLDTTAPTVTWGAQTGTTAGELLQLAYSADEPVDSADLTLNGGRVLQLTVDPTILSVALPADSADGPAGVRVRDDVGNERVYPAIVVIHGVVVVVPPPTTGAGPPRRGQRPRSGTVRRYVVVRATTTSHVRAHARSHSAVRFARTAVITAVRARGELTHETTIYRLQSRHTTRAAPATAGLELAIRRRDGPDLEGLLLLL